MLVYPRSKVTPPRHFCSEEQSSVSTPASRNWSALLLCAPGREVPGLRSGGTGLRRLPNLAFISVHHTSISRRRMNITGIMWSRCRGAAGRRHEALTASQSKPEALSIWPQCPLAPPLGKSFTVPSASYLYLQWFSINALP